MADGTCAIIHINRLKKAYKQTKGESALPLNNNLREKVKIKGFYKVAPRGNDDVQAGKLVEEFHSHPPVRDVECSEWGECDSDLDSWTHRRVGDPEWTAGSSCLEKKLPNDNTADDIAYRLRSVLVSRSEREAETDKRKRKR